MTPSLTLLVGLPGCGKSTFVSNHVDKFTEAVVLSTDAYLERVARLHGKTYDEVWKSCIDAAETEMWAEYRQALADRRDIVVDRTNLTVKARRRFLSQVPRGYVLSAVVFNVADSVIKQRILNRPGKTISMEVIERMKDTYVEPQLSEGFDLVATAHALEWLAAA